MPKTKLDKLYDKHHAICGKILKLKSGSLSKIDSNKFELWLLASYSLFDILPQFIFPTVFPNREKGKIEQANNYLKPLGYKIVATDESKGKTDES